MGTFIATLTNVEMTPGSTVAVCTAIGEQGDTIRFGADWRPALTLKQMLQETDDDVLVEVEGWQVLSVT